MKGTMIRAMVQDAVGGFGERIERTRPSGAA